MFPGRTGEAVRDGGSGTGVWRFSRIGAFRRRRSAITDPPRFMRITSSFTSFIRSPRRPALAIPLAWLGRVPGRLEGKGERELAGSARSAALRARASVGKASVRNPRRPISASLLRQRRHPSARRRFVARGESNEDCNCPYFKLAETACLVERSPQNTDKAVAASLGPGQDRPACPRDL
jgi:hypothetical protein